MSETVDLAPAGLPPAGPPPRRPTWSRWRPAMRLAARDARRGGWRTLVVLALVALPVAAASGVYLWGTDIRAGELSRPRLSLGTVAAGSVEAGNAQRAELDTEQLPVDWRLVPWPQLTAWVDRVVTADVLSGTTVPGTSGDFTDPVLAGLVELRGGRLPATDHEVVISPALAAERALGIGDTWLLDLGTTAANYLPAQVVGIAEFAGMAEQPAFGIGGPTDGQPQWGPFPQRYLIASPNPITSAQVNSAFAAGMLVVARDAALPDALIEDPAQLWISEELAVGVALTFVEIVLLVGVAFTVTVRRRQRGLALLAAAGAEPGDLTRAVLASGLLLGGLGAVIGFAVPWVILVLGRPVFESLSARPLVAVPPATTAIVLVPIIAVLAALAASLIPAALAARIPLAAALRSPDGVTVGGAHPDRGDWRTAGRAGVFGLLAIGIGLGLLAWYAAGEDQATGAAGLLASALGVGLVAVEIGIALLAPAMVAVVGGWDRLPLTARLSAREAARNRLRTAFAVAAVAGAVGLVAGPAIYAWSQWQAAATSYIAALPPGTAIVALDAVPEEGVPGADYLELARQVEAAYPQAGVVPVRYAPEAGLGPRLASACTADDLGIGTGQIAGMAEPELAALVASLPLGSPCRAPVVAGDSVSRSAAFGASSSAAVGYLVAPADAATWLLGVNAPAARRALAAGRAVALDPSAETAGQVSVRAASTLLRRVGKVKPGEVHEFPAEFIVSRVRPAAAIVTPGTAAGRGLPHTPNVLLVSGIADFANLPAGLYVSYVERGPDLRLWLSGSPWKASLVPLGFALVATLLVTTLAVGESRRDCQVMGALGAGPRVQRRFAMWSAVLIGSLGAGLGILMAVPGAWAALRAVPWVFDQQQCLWPPVWPGTGVPDPVICPVPLEVPAAIPWVWMAALLVAIPAMSALVFAVLPTSRAAPPRR